MKKIKLSQGKFALVDDEDFEFLNQWKWCANRGTGCRTLYATRHTKRPNRKTLSMHRVIMKTPIGLQVDHKDKNGLNNQKYNLRNCTASQNGANRISVGKSKYLGVTLYKNQINSRIRINGKRIYLGAFKTEEEAAVVYNKAAIKYHGEFANLNIIL